MLANGTSSNNDGAPVQEQTYSAGDNQKWRFTTVPGGFYEIVNRASGKSLDVTVGSSNDGAVMQQWSYLGGGNQQWQFVAVPD